MLEHLYFPHDISTFGPKIDWLFELIFWIVMVVWVAVMIAMVVFMIRYRTRPGRKAEYIEGNSRLEIIWTTATTVILIILAYYEPLDVGRYQRAWAAGRRVLPGEREAVQLGNYLPRTPTENSARASSTMDNELHVPVNKVVRIDLTSKDVIHSFYVPNMRLRQDAVPGRIIHVWFEATETGQYEIPCSELCGFGHSGMKGNLTVQSQEDFDKWLKDQYSQNK